MFPDLSNYFGECDLIIADRDEGQDYKNTWVVTNQNDPWSLHEQPKDKRMHCNRKVYMQGVNGADDSSVHIFLYWLITSYSVGVTWGWD